MRRAAGAAVLALVLAGCEQGGRASGLPPADFEPDPAKGRMAFRVNCAGCHGATARGTDKGPPLIHSVYRPGHHADLSFYWAVRDGVRQHHWHFGDMPPRPDVSPEQAGHIVAWVRAEQRRAGIE